jgi:hypothetical protein
MNRRGVAVIAIAVVGIAGCGSTSSGLSPAAYKSEISKICAVNNAKITALPASTSNSVSGLEKAYSIVESTLSQVKGITAPSSLSAAVSSWLSTVEQESAIATTMVSDLKAGKTAALQSLLSRANSLETKGKDAAKSLGLTSCTVSAQPSGH